MTKSNKTEKIEIRIDSNSKQAFLEYCQNHSIKASVLLRQFIEECIKNGSN